MLQRLGLAQAIMENPDVLILDEFSNALDEEGVSLVYNILLEEKNKGKIIIVTSHVAADVDSLCDETFRLKDGILYHEKTK